MVCFFPKFFFGDQTYQPMIPNFVFPLQSVVSCCSWCRIVFILLWSVPFLSSTTCSTRPFSLYHRTQRAGGKAEISSGNSRAKEAFQMEEFEVDHLHKTNKFIDLLHENRDNVKRYLWYLVRPGQEFWVIHISGRSWGFVCERRSWQNLTIFAIA